MPRLSLLLLGSFQVTLDRQPVVGFESDKARALLAYLSVESDRPHTREKLAGLLWPESSEAAARASLSEALANLRYILGDRDARPPFLLASRQSVQFNCESDAFVDVVAFEALSGARNPSRAGLADLEQAVTLYRGRFLEGFSLSGCSEFEEWLLLEQEHLQRLAMAALDRLAAACEAEGQLERALACAWRQLSLDPLWESAHRQAMRLLARSGQRDAALVQYRACCRLLDKELAAKPSGETIRLYEQIRNGQLPVELAPPPNIDELPLPLPGFLAGQASAAARPVFVAREAELARLDRLLCAALEGQCQAAFVVGGPGRGKTVLLQEFARRAMDAHPELLLAMGTCNAYTGAGDPYLPFRGVLSMLTGDAEGPWASGILSAGQARRMWNALPEVAPVLARWGSGLVGTLLPGRDLLGRARAVASVDTPAAADWLPLLERLAEPRTNPPGGLEQSHLCEQYANVLLNLSARRPLLLVLDDLQWADLASIGLLFHLGRRVEWGRVLLAGAYRPHELALGRDGQRHPLESALTEFRTRFGDVWLDLAAADEAQGRLFVDRYLDTEPNALGEGFRAALFSRTRGHPLFTVELLRVMQQRGGLARDPLGRWTEGDRLEWGALPARVEATIAERIDRLPEELREMLAVASVEGEEFTAQAVALVQGMDELQVLRLIRGQLVGRHRLVREQGEVRLDGRSLSRCRFSHFLVQQHVYQGLGDVERRLLHRRVGEALERLYEGRLEQIATELTRHFAGDPERERKYARLAGERAAAQFANDEAVRYLSRALELTPPDERRERYELMLARERVYDLLGQRDAQRLAELEVLADGLGTKEQAELRVWLGQVQLEAAAYAEAARQFEAAQMLARIIGEQRFEAQALEGLGRVCYMHSAYSDADRLLRDSLALARATGDAATHAASARMLAIIAMFQGRYEEARDWIELCHALCEKIGDRRQTSSAIRVMGHLASGQGHWEEARRQYGAALALAEEIGDRLSAAKTLAWMGHTIDVSQGALAEARVCFERSRSIAEELGARHLVADDLQNLSCLACQEGAYGEAETLQCQAIALCRDLDDAVMLAGAQSGLGYIFVLQGRHAAAWDLLIQQLRMSLASDLSAEVVAGLLHLVGQMGVRIGRFQRGAELLGLGLHHTPGKWQAEAPLRRELDMARAALGTEALEAALARGAALDLDQVISGILACDTPEAYWDKEWEAAPNGAETNPIDNRCGLVYAPVQ